MKKLMICLGLLFLLCVNIFSQQKKVMIEGEYSYTFGDNESLIEAKNICYTMAIRNAIESYNIFVTSTSTVKNYRMMNDLIQTISSGYLENLRIIKNEVKDRTVNYKIQAYVDPEVMKNVLTRELRRIEKRDEFLGVTEGKFLKILSTKKIIDNSIVKIEIVYQKKGKEYEGAWDDYIKIDYFNSDGDPIEGDKLTTIRGLDDEEIRRTFFTMPKDAKSYRVWLTE